MTNNSSLSAKDSALTDQNQTAKQQSKSKWTTFARLAFVGLVASSLVGCVGRFTGGGSIDSIAGAPQKATFGFVIDATNPDEDGNPTAVTGQFQYNDHAAGVSFHVDQLTPGAVGRIYPDIFAPDPAVIFAYSGTYSCAAGTGELALGVASDQQVFEGMNNKDALFVTVFTGPYAGYDNVGLVQNGKIQFKPAKSK